MAISSRLREKLHQTFREPMEAPMDIPGIFFSKSFSGTRRFSQPNASAQPSSRCGKERATLAGAANAGPHQLRPPHQIGARGYAGSGLAYWWSRWNRWGLVAVVLCLALNWLGDSLDGTLARYRNRQRPRYGFYVDHISDAFGLLFLLTGLALSGFMSWPVTAGCWSRI